MAFSDWSTTAASNTSIGGISIAEGCPPSNLNNAAREMMAQLRAAFAPGLSAFFVAADPTAALGILGGLSKGGDTVTGNIVRYGRGPHLHHANPAFGSGEVFYTAVGAPDPTSVAGDVWFTGS